MPNCSRSKLTHAMVVIGYGVSSGSKYWLVKNRYNMNFAFHTFSGTLSLLQLGTKLGSEWTCYDESWQV